MYRPMVQFNCSLQTAGANWPKGTLDSVKVLILEKLKQVLVKGSVKLAQLVSLIE
jgi:hypothetical protein